MRIYSNGKSIQVLGKQGIRGMAGPDGSPIGTVIDYMGKSAPDDYLICNGETYQISDWPDLADFFETQYGRKNEFGGDGALTFGVPTLSGERGILKCIKAKTSEPYEDIYSEEETVVGRWINGKPIYRRAFIFSSVRGEVPGIDITPDIDVVISLYGSLKDGSGYLPFTFYHADVYTSLHIEDNKLLCHIIKGNNTLLNKPALAILEYTKTTDEATIKIPVTALFPLETLKEMAETPNLNFDIATTATDII